MMRAPTATITWEELQKTFQDVPDSFRTEDLPAPFRAPDDLSELDDLEPYIGYIRVSTWREEKISPELQKSAIEEWARKTGRRIIGWIVDLDATGRNFKRKIMRGVEAIEAGFARGIAVWRYSRFGRNRTGNAVNLARLEYAGGRLESATEPVDAETAIGEFQREMIFAFGNFESNRAGEQWRETHEHRRNTERLPATGRKRFGYIWHRRWDPRTETLQKERYSLDPETAEIVLEAYERKVHGNEGFTTICAWLNSLGLRTTQGNPWEQSALRKYMDSGFPAGLLRVHNQDCKCTEMSTCKNFHFMPGAQPAIVDQELWDAYLAHRELIKSQPPRERNATYPLTGLMRHGDCQRSLAAFRGGSTGATVNGYGYRCNWYTKSGGTACTGVSITRAKVEMAVLTFLANEVAPGVDAAPPVQQRRRQDVDRARDLAKRERERLTKQIKKLSDGLARLRADHAVNADDYEPGEYEAARDKIRKEKAAAEQALQDVVEVETTPQQVDFQPLVLGLLDEWDTLTVGEKNGILRKLLRRVSVVRIDRGRGKRATSRVEIHPVWEPDPWAPQKVSLVKQPKQAVPAQRAPHLAVVA
ncbi:recombinase family protein [Streptomyces sp. NPDC018019]|uniref:recombinase family protein n=1 Tax=Streptomyces sp. NPDC018019 TaxID=3365030 RepID=UPI0037972144